ncbi:MAG: acetate kinase [Deltaproteobacteria bacterium]|nr:acetate kinase [Deltaproteobacteria bacterium]
MKVLVINTGSSSIKFELFQMPEEKVEASGLLQRIGEEGSELSYSLKGEKYKIAQKVPDHGVGLKLIISALTDGEKGGIEDISEIGAVGHRVVHGGEAFAKTAKIDADVLQAVRDHIDLAPLHNPPNILGIEVATSALPKALQVAVFDTSFHQSIPPHAYLYPVPYELYENQRVRRYGFHGTSHRYVTQRAAELLDKPIEELNVITAHLGNGASITAVRGGKSVDTSMGLTPLEGLMMGTRCGDIDPALIAFLERTQKMSVGDIDKLLNKKSGLLGISGVSNDMRTCEEAAAKGNERAQIALEMYAYRVKKYVGAYTAVLGRVDALVFTAGAGENGAELRAQVLENMEPLGYKIDPERNAVRGKEADVSTADSPIRVLVIPTNEELMIARDTYVLASA